MTVNLRDRLKNEAKEGGFRPHPVGSFPGKVNDIVQREVQGKTVWEIQLVTPEGKARVTIWNTTYADVDGELLKVCGGDRAKAEDRYVKTIGRLMRLYADLGCVEPDGASQQEIEAACYDRLAELIDKECTVVVQAKKDDAQNPWVYINAPSRGKARGNGATRSEAPPVMSSPASVPVGHPDTPSLDQIPF